MSEPESTTPRGSVRARRARRAALLLSLALPVALLTACEPPAIAGQGYQVVFEDQFDGPTLDPIWQNAPFGGGQAPTVSSGSMILTSTPTAWAYAGSTGPRQQSEPNYPSAASWQEGYFEARLRFTDDPWAWPAFWLFSMAKSEAWPQTICPPVGQYTSEWDIMEGGLNNADGSRPASRSTHSVLHRNTENGSAGPWCGLADETRSVHHVSPSVNLADWHTWGGLWTEDEVCLYLDDALVGCLPTYDTTAQPMHLIFTINYHGLCGGCPAKPAQLQMEVDWVRVWQQP